MKNKIYQVIIMAWMVLHLCPAAFAQECEPRNIRTDFDNPLNNERPDVQNNGVFDWVNNSRFNTVGIAHLQSGNPANTIENPFWVNDDDAPFSHLALAEESDFLPENGWELLIWDLGYIMDGRSNRDFGTSYDLITPYFALYNKYSGQIRLFSNTDYNQTYTAATTHLRLIDPRNPPYNVWPNTDGLHATGLFNFHGKTASPLDDTTRITDVIMPTTPANSDLGWNYAEFQTAYDPCTCGQKAWLRGEFEYLTEGEIELEGALLGTIQKKQVKSSSNGPLVADALVSFGLGASFAVTGNPIGLTKSLPNALGDLIKVGEHAEAHPDLLKAGEIMQAYSVFLNSPPFKLDKAALNEYDKAYKSFSKLMDFYTASMYPKSAGGTIVQGDIKLTGKVKYKTSVQGDGWMFAVPGSKESETYPERRLSLDPAYPVYNEILGVFALLETPEVELFHGYEYTFTGETQDRYVLRAKDDFFKYAFNPALDIDEERTKVRVAFKIKHTLRNIGKNHNLNHLFPDIPKYMPVDSVNMSATPIYENDSQKVINGRLAAVREMVFHTDYFDPNIFSNLAFGQEFQSEVMFGHTYSPMFEVHLKVNLDIYYNDLDQNGDQIHHQMVLTYPVKISDTDSDPSKLQEHINLLQQEVTLGDRHFTKDEVIYASTININGLITADPGVKVLIIGGEGINMNGGAIGEGEMLLTSSLHEVFGVEPARQQAEEFITSFCENQYKAYLRLPVSEASLEVPPKPIEGDIVSFKIYPNPSRGRVAFLFELEDVGFAQVRVFDLAGKSVHATPEGVRFFRGSQEIVTDLSHLEKGVYIARLITKKGAMTKRFLIE